MKRVQYALLIVTQLAAVFAVSTPSQAWAQTAPEVLSGWKVQVVTNDGRTARGTVLDVSATTLNLREGERPTSIHVSDIRSIDREMHDSVFDGFGKGAGVGAAGGALIFLSGYSCKAGPCTGLDSRGFVVGAGAEVGAVFGGVAGLILDATHHARRRVYPKPATAVAIFPLTTPHTIGVGGTIRW